MPDADVERAETLLHIGDPIRGRQWQTALPDLVPNLDVRQWPDIGDSATIRYLAAWNPPEGVFAALPNLEVVFSVGAGVDHIDFAAVPKFIPVIRMTEPGLTQGVVEYATFAVLALHRGMLRYFDLQRNADWIAAEAVPTSTRRVGVLGLGILGGAIARHLVTLSFPVSGWSRSARQIDGVTSFAGSAALPAFLAETDILVCILPLTSDTRGILGAEIFAALPQGASIVNIGRGDHLDEEALLSAMDDGHIAEAVLDVTRQEPLPPSHRFWNDPRILITPHIAGTTSVAGGATAIAENIRRYRSKMPLTGVVDRLAGY